MVLSSPVFWGAQGPADAALHSLLVRAVLEQELRHCCAAGEVWEGVPSAVPPVGKLR